MLLQTQKALDILQGKIAVPRSLCYSVKDIIGEDMYFEYIIASQLYVHSWDFYFDEIDWG